MIDLIAPIPVPPPLREPPVVTSLRQQLRRGSNGAVLYRIAGGAAAFWRLVSAYSLADGLSATGTAQLAMLKAEARCLQAAQEGAPEEVAFRKCPAPVLAPRPAPVTLATNEEKAVAPPAARRERPRRRPSLTGKPKFWAAHAGGDPAAVEVVRLCIMAGITPRSVRAPFTLQKLVCEVGVTAAGLALELLVEVHGDTPNAVRAPTVAALARCATAKGFSPRRALKVLRGLDVDALHDDARRDRVTGGGSLAAAMERVLRRHLELSVAA